ncbi:macro domain-containing protein [Candidatus Zixiibacteriota bacterium]
MTETLQKEISIQINQSVIRLIRDDVTDIEVDAFVYYAQHDLALGSGFGGAIAVRGGPSVQKELDGLGPLETGEAVVSGAGNLKADSIIHAVGPRFQEENIEEKLRTTMMNTLRCAEEKGFRRIAFPAMGAGYYGILPAVSAEVMMEAIKSHLETQTEIQELIICVFDTPQFDAFQSTMAKQN